MTRINLVDPSHLTDKHLVAEYRELPRIFTSVKKLVQSGKWSEFISSEHSDSYLLGKGHMKFFYTRLPWLKLRYMDLNIEMKKRGMSPDENLYSSISYSIVDTIDSVSEDQLPYWKPSPEEIYLNMARLCIRSNITEVLMEITD